MALFHWRNHFPGPLDGRGLLCARKLPKWLDDKIISCDLQSLNLDQFEHLRKIFGVICPIAFAATTILKTPTEGKSFGRNRAHCSRDMLKGSKLFWWLMTLKRPWFIVDIALTGCRPIQAMRCIHNAGLQHQDGLLVFMVQSENT